MRETLAWPRVTSIAPAGDHALLIELDRSISAADLHAAAKRVRALDGVLACIVGQSSLYVAFENEPKDVTAAINDASPRQPATGNRQRATVSFRDEHAPDLNEFLTRTKVT